MDVGLLDHGRQGFLYRTAGFQKCGEVASRAELRDARLRASGPGQPVPVAMAGPPRQALGRLLAVAGPRLAAPLILPMIDPRDRSLDGLIPSGARRRSRPPASFRLHSIHRIECSQRNRLQEHLAEQTRVAALFHELSEVHHRLGHRRHPLVQVGFRNQTLPRNPMTAVIYTTRWGTISIVPS